MHAQWSLWAALAHTALCLLGALQYVGGMHGDEPLGRQLILYLADWLCDNYPANPRVSPPPSLFPLPSLPFLPPLAHGYEYLQVPWSKGHQGTRLESRLEAQLPAELWPHVHQQPHALILWSRLPSEGRGVSVWLNRSLYRVPCPRWRAAAGAVQAASILEQVQVHLLPAMNPDGFALRRRENARGVDLNRDFPDPVSTAAPQGPPFKGGP